MPWGANLPAGFALEARRIPEGFELLDALFQQVLRWSKEGKTERVGEMS